MSDRISALKALAEKATPGPWTHTIMDVAPASDPVNGTIAIGLAWPIREYAKREANMAYISAASPDVILRVCEVVEKAKAAELALVVGLAHTRDKFGRETDDSRGIASTLAALRSAFSALEGRQSSTHTAET